MTIRSCLRNQTQLVELLNATGAAIGPSPSADDDQVSALTNLHNITCIQTAAVLRIVLALFASLMKTLAPGTRLYVVTEAQGAPNELPKSAEWLAWHLRVAWLSAGFAAADFVILDLHLLASSAAVDMAAILAHGAPHVYFLCVNDFAYSGNQQAGEVERLLKEFAAARDLAGSTALATVYVLVGYAMSVGVQKIQSTATPAGCSIEMLYEELRGVPGLTFATHKLPDTLQPDAERIIVQVMRGDVIPHYKHPNVARCKQQAFERIEWR